MTREDAIHFANCLKNNYTIDLNDMQAFCDEAIKALEQEPISDILEDIYFDIEKEYEDCVIGKLDDDEMCPCFRRITDIYGVLDIIDKYIDKYKAEYAGRR